MFKDFIQKYKNARKAVKQIKNGEWVVSRYSSIDGKPYRAEREEKQLWLANGPFFCEIEGGGVVYFGLFWRHYVWWAAARKLAKKSVGVL